MAMDIPVQRLQLEDVVMIDVLDQGEVEALVVRPVERTATSVRVTLRPEGGDELVKEWNLGELVTVVRGP
jgi:hypothetical protein